MPKKSIPKKSIAKKVVLTGAEFQHFLQMHTINGGNRLSTTRITAHNDVAPDVYSEVARELIGILETVFYGDNWGFLQFLNEQEIYSGGYASLYKLVRGMYITGYLGKSAEEIERLTCKTIPKYKASRGQKDLPDIVSKMENLVKYINTLGKTAKRMGRELPIGLVYLIYIIARWYYFEIQFVSLNGKCYLIGNTEPETRYFQVFKDEVQDIGVVFEIERDSYELLQQTAKCYFNYFGFDMLLRFRRQANSGRITGCSIQQKVRRNGTVL